MRRQSTAPTSLPADSPACQLRVSGFQHKHLGSQRQLRWRLLQTMTLRRISALNLAEKKQMSGVLKAKYMRHRKAAERVMDLWIENIEDAAVAQRARNQMVILRNDCENVFRAYDVIQGTVGMADAEFKTSFEPKIEEMTEELDRLEVALTKSSKDAKEMQRRRIRDTEAPREEERGEERHKLNLEMN